MAPRPWNLIAELTYRCPLRCPYCSNPSDHAAIREGLDAEAWGRVFAEAAALGCVHVGLTGGEPSTRRDLDAIVRHAARAGLYVHLVTAGLPLRPEALPLLREAGLRSVQLSIQDADPATADAIAGTESFARKLAVARAAREAGLALTINVVLHRHNLDRRKRAERARSAPGDAQPAGRERSASGREPSEADPVAELVALARRLDADRLELAHAQYDGWALRNRAALLPTRAQVEAAAATVRAERARGPRPEILLVLPDWFAGRPKPCMGGWGQRIVVVAPDGLVLPCHAARGLPGLEFWSFAERGLRACWEDAPGMNAFRGEAWMREPCRSCPERVRDFGGCRCQAYRLAGDASDTDPACSLAPRHEALRAAREVASDAAELVYRG
jgi:pyrroloquinoline quinone biosynthesis protein E